MHAAVMAVSASGRLGGTTRRCGRRTRVRLNIGYRANPRS